MRKRTLLAGAIAVLAIGGGTAGAIAAGNETEKAVLADAADRLGVSPDELRTALEQAENAQLDAAVKAGDLTEEQADAIRAHREREDSVLGFGHGPGVGGPRFHHRFRGGPPFVSAAAKALGLTERQLFDRLREGETLAEVAKAEGKTLDDVRAAVRKAVVERFGEAPEWLDELLERLGEGPGFGPPGPFGGRGHDGSRP